MRLDLHGLVPNNATLHRTSCATVFFSCVQNSTVSPCQGCIEPSRVKCFVFSPKNPHGEDRVLVIRLKSNQWNTFSKAWHCIWTKPAPVKIVHSIKCACWPVAAVRPSEPLIEGGWMSVAVEAQVLLLQSGYSYNALGSVVFDCGACSTVKWLKDSKQ